MKYSHIRFQRMEANALIGLSFRKERGNRRCAALKKPKNGFLSKP
jgi:hypothetical protein